MCMLASTEPKKVELATGTKSQGCRVVPKEALNIALKVPTTQRPPLFHPHPKRSPNPLIPSPHTPTC